MHATDVNPLFYSALLLSALPVPLLTQVREGGVRGGRDGARSGFARRLADLFFRVFEVLFSCLFSARFLEGVGRVFWRPYGSFWINFEVIWESFL